MSSEGEEKKLNYIDSSALAAILPNGGVTVIDVRNEDFSTSHIPSAVNVPYGEQWEDDTFLDQLISSVGDKGTVVFHCMHSKQRGPFCAKNFARRLEEVTLEHKPEVLVLSGGFHDWDQTQNEKEKEK